VPRVSLSRIIRVFAWTGLTSVGGGRYAFFYDAVVVRRPWVRSEEFVQDLTLCQFLPGPNQGYCAPISSQALNRQRRSGPRSGS
jgi:chromate transport protein ChrA